MAEREPSTDLAFSYGSFQRMSTKKAESGRVDNNDMCIPLASGLLEYSVMDLINSMMPQNKGTERIRCHS